MFTCLLFALTLSHEPPITAFPDGDTAMGELTADSPEWARFDPGRIKGLLARDRSAACTPVTKASRPAINSRD